MKPPLAFLVIVIAVLGIGVTMTLRTRSSEQPTLAAAAGPDTITRVQTRVLNRPDAEHPESFTSIKGVRELKDGRILVLDSRRGPYRSWISSMDVLNGSAGWGKDR